MRNISSQSTFFFGAAPNLAAQLHMGPRISEIPLGSQTSQQSWHPYTNNKLKPDGENIFIDLDSEECYIEIVLVTVTVLLDEEGGIEFEGI
jgi:hypothetical protein